MVSGVWLFHLLRKWDINGGQWTQSSAFCTEFVSTGNESVLLTLVLNNSVCSIIHTIMHVIWTEILYCPETDCLLFIAVLRSICRACKFTENIPSLQVIH